MRWRLRACLSCRRQRWRGPPGERIPHPTHRISTGHSRHFCDARRVLDRSGSAAPAPIAAWPTAGERRCSRRRISRRAVAATTIRAVAHLVPDARPLLAPGEGTPACRTNLGRQVGLALHLRPSTTVRRPSTLRRCSGRAQDISSAEATARRVSRFDGEYSVYRRRAGRRRWGQRPRSCGASASVAHCARQPMRRHAFS